MSTVVETARRQRAILPLCVDLDGTLIHSNLLWECIVLLLKTHAAWLVPFWLTGGGRVKLKPQLARRALLEPKDLP
jgi:hypothetical protein